MALVCAQVPVSEEADPVHAMTEEVVDELLKLVWTDMCQAVS